MIKVQLNTVKGFEDVRDVYQVCREGDKCWVEGRNGVKMKGSNCHSYFQIEFYNNGLRKRIQQHRLFAMCFIPNPNNKEQVNHIDGVKSNNLLSNLEWVSPSDNLLHADRTGLRKCASGENNGSAKLSKSDLQIIFDLRKTGLTLKEIGEQIGVIQQQIHNILSGKSRQTETTLLINL